MSFLTESLTMYGIPEREEPKKKKKYDLIPHCKYNDGVSCEAKGRKCTTCGWNPVVAEMRKQAIYMGDTHFLRCADRDYNLSEEEIKSLIQARA